MTEQIGSGLNPDVEAKVDALSEAGNEEALNEALNAEISQNSDPAQDDHQITETSKADVEDTQTPDNNDSVDSEKNQDDQQDVKQKTANRYKKLLADRTEARNEAADAKLDAQANEKRIADLEAENKRLKSGDQGDEDNSSTDTNKNKSIEDLVKKQVEDVLGQRDKTTAAEKSNIAEVEALESNPNTPNAKDHQDLITQAMDRFDMNAEQAYTYLKGAGEIQADDASASSNAAKLNTGSQPKHNLVRDVKPKDMSTGDMEAHLKKEQAAGRLSL